MIVRLLIACAMLMGSTLYADAQVRIGNDNGGRIGTYVDKYASLKYSDEPVVIDGQCASACTIVLGAVPRDRICVTPKASLGFHAAWDFGDNGKPVTNPLATAYLLTMYPAHIRKCIGARGGLRKKMIFLRGKQLAGFYQPCA